MMQSRRCESAGGERSEYLEQITAMTETSRLESGGSVSMVGNTIIAGPCHSSGSLESGRDGDRMPHICCKLLVAALAREDIWGGRFEIGWNGILPQVQKREWKIRSSLRGERVEALRRRHSG